MYNINNREQIKQTHHEYYETNKDIISQKQKEYYELHSDDVKQRSKDYYYDNQEKFIQLSIDYKKQHPECAEYSKEYNKILIQFAVLRGSDNLIEEEKFMEKEDLFEELPLNQEIKILDK